MVLPAAPAALGSFTDDDRVAGLEVTPCNLGKSPVFDADGDSNRNRLGGSEDPDLSFGFTRDRPWAVCSR